MCVMHLSLPNQQGSLERPTVPRLLAGFRRAKQYSWP